MALFTVAGAVLLALWLRVGPCRPFVFTSWGVDFQEPDAWFHARTARNLLAHFPFRSGFDPYALFPKGMNLPTGPLWDYMIASLAWVLGFGSPSSGLTDAVAAWLPAILGAICPAPVFLVSRRLFGTAAGIFAALWVAVTPGEFIWLTHLGNADHHAAEGLFSLLVFCFLCFAAESESAAPAIAAGISLGALLATQPAAIFVPGIIVAAAMLAPSLALPAVYAFATAAITLLPIRHGLYLGYDWLSLGAAIAAGVAIWFLNRWPSWARWIAALVASSLAFAATYLTRPELIPSLAREIGSLNQSNVAELQPVVVFSRSLAKNFEEMNGHLGVVWMPAIPGLIWAGFSALRKGTGPIALLAVFSWAFTIAAFLHLRMILYYTPFACILAGVVCAWLTEFAPAIKYRVIIGGAIAGLVLAFNIPSAVERMASRSAGAGQDWYAALTWLRLHSPEPFEAAGFWTGYFPWQSKDSVSPAPHPSYGIGVWWDTGYMVENLSHRLPIANGFDAGVEENGGQLRTRDMARFYASLFPESAVDLLRRLNARYVIVDPTIPVFPTMVGRSKFDVIEQTAGSDSSRLYRTLWHDEGGYRKPMFVYFSDYYQTMGVRLFLNDGETVHGTGPVVFRVQSDGIHDVITRATKFRSARAAGDFAAMHSNENLVVGCDDPVVSCFDVEAVQGLHRVFASDPSPLSIRRGITAVKIFEVR